MHLPAEIWWNILIYCDKYILNQYLVIDRFKDIINNRNFFKSWCWISQKHLINYIELLDEEKFSNKFTNEFKYNCKILQTIENQYYQESLVKRISFLLEGTRGLIWSAFKSIPLEHEFNQIKSTNYVNFQAIKSLFFKYDIDSMFEHLDKEDTTHPFSLTCDIPSKYYQITYMKYIPEKYIHALLFTGKLSMENNDWVYITKCVETEEFVLKYFEKLNWNDPYLYNKLSEVFLKQNRQLWEIINWNLVLIHISLSEDFLENIIVKELCETYQVPVNLSYMASYQKLSIPFIKKIFCNTKYDNTTNHDLLLSNQKEWASYQENSKCQNLMNDKN